MNKIILLGRLVADPETRVSTNETRITRYRLAVNKRFKREGEPDADFFNCIAFGKQAEFAANYLAKGMKVAIAGSVQTGSYEKEGVKHYTFDVIVDEHDFADSKASSDTTKVKAEPSHSEDIDKSGFMAIDYDIEELPFA